MSKASQYGAAAGAAIMEAIRLHIGDQVYNQEPMDIIAYLLEYFEAEYLADGEEYSADSIVANALVHVDAERGEGDDLSDDPYYDELLWRLEVKVR